ncbi:MAG: alpha/beta fold hydrolase [Candidatus Eremiobacteraeota bacterium]|nr:alpha/beta fold hydrolase [Candidatus Eremiobacteraeota bacterium]
MAVELIRVAAGTHDLAVLRYVPRQPRGVTVVAGHGYSSSKHNLDFLCAFLAAHGFDVLSLDFPGHKLGASGGVLRGVDDLTASMAAVVQYAYLSQDPLYALGHSMGAMTALFVAGADARIAGTVAIATGYGRPSAIESLQSRGVTDFRSSYVDGLSLPELLNESIDLRYDEALAGLSGRPQLYVAARRDTMVNRASVESLYDHARETKSFVTIDSDHTYAAENARGEVLQWLNQRHPRR